MEKINEILLLELGYWILGGFVLAQILDVVSTRSAMKKANTREINPVMGWAMERLGDNGWVVFKLLVAGGAGGWLWWASQVVVVVFMTFVTLIVAMNNFRLGAKG